MPTTRFASFFAAMTTLLLEATIARAQPVPADVVITPVVTTGLVSPIGVFTADEPLGRIFVIQQGGEVRVVRAGALVSAPFLDLSVTGEPLQCTYPGDSAPTVVGLTSGGERGLLGLAFHPGFNGSGVGRGVFFASITDANGDTMILRYTMADPTLDALTAGDRSTCRVILRADQDFSNHNGGHIVFGPDGFLYFGLGDGGSGGDPCGRGQTLDPAALNPDGTCAPDANFTANGGDPDSRALLGKMLRLDIDATTPANTSTLCGAPRINQVAEYGIPSGQPGAAAGTIPQACDEVWAYGLRNPWRWSFDRQNGDLWIGDVGQGAWEEVNRWRPGIDPPGADFGWVTCEGRNASGGSVCSAACPTGTNRVNPVIAYRNSNLNCAGNTTSNGCSVTGGHVYRGPTSVLGGTYFYGDACRSQIRYANETGGNNWVEPTAAVIVSTDVNGAAIAGAVLAFGEDQGGALFFVGGGTLYRIGAASVAPPAGLIFSNGFEP